MPFECARQPVIIMGMARSGTSLIAGLLQRLGLFLGQRKFGADEEAALFYRLNQILLRRIHGEFDNPAPMRYFLRNNSAVEMTVKCLAADVASCRIIGYLGLKQFLKYRSLARYDKPWGWKDPLNVFTLPLWLQLFPQAKIIYIVRNGVDVASSLAELHGAITAKRQIRNQKKSGVLSRRRNVELYGFKGAARCLSLEGSFSLWEEFVSQAEETLARIPNARKAIGFENFLADPKSHLLDLCRFCELAEVSESAIDEVAKRVDVNRSRGFRSTPALASFYDSIKESSWMVHYGYGER